MLFLISSTISVFISRWLRLPFLHEHFRKVVAYAGIPRPPVQNVRTTPCRARPTCLSGGPKFVRTQPTFHKFRAKVRSDSRSDLPPNFQGSCFSSTYLHPPPPHELPSLLFFPTINMWNSRSPVVPLFIPSRPARTNRSC